MAQGSAPTGTLSTKLPFNDVGDDDDIPLIDADAGEDFSPGPYARSPSFQPLAPSLGNPKDRIDTGGQGASPETPESQTCCDGDKNGLVDTPQTTGSNSFVKMASHYNIHFPEPYEGEDDVHHKGDAPRDTALPVLSEDVSPVKRMRLQVPVVEALASSPPPDAQGQENDFSSSGNFRVNVPSYAYDDSTHRTTNGDDQDSSADNESLPLLNIVEEDDLSSYSGKCSEYSSSTSSGNNSPTLPQNDNNVDGNCALNIPEDTATEATVPAVGVTPRLAASPEEPTGIETSPSEDTNTIRKQSRNDLSASVNLPSASISSNDANRKLEQQLMASIDTASSADEKSDDVRIKMTSVDDGNAKSEKKFGNGNVQGNGPRKSDESASEPPNNDKIVAAEKSLATFFVGNDSNPTTRQNSCMEDNALLTSNENGTAVGNGKDVESPGVTLRHGSSNQISLLLNNLFVILSGLYGILIVVLGSVIPLTEIFVEEDGAAFEAFYLYLYSVSILFLAYVYAYLLRRNRLRTEFLKRSLSRSMSFTRNWASSWIRTGSEKSRTRKRMVSLDESNHHTGTFYLRLGVLGFGIGSMIHSGLNFGKFFGSITEGQCPNGVSLLMKPLLHLIFTFSQLYFIFMNSKMCIHRYKVLARFGLMHMAATNICVWFRSIVVETLHEIHHHHAHEHEHGDDISSHHVTDHMTHDNTSYPEAVSYHHDDVGGENLTVSLGRKLLAAAVSNGNGSGDGNSGGLLELRCSWNNMMGKAVDSAGPYLYPCTIEYSLMCAGILYVMWNNVGMRPRRKTISQLEDEEEDYKQQRMSVDCTGSSRGLFLGIFLTVCAIISIIAFYVMVSQPHLKSQALLLTHLSETFIYVVTMLALIAATVKMRYLVFHADHTSDLEETLIIIAYTGLLAFNIFSLIAAILKSDQEGANLTILSNFTMMLQSAFQTIFMLAGDRMSAANAMQERKKPGREFVTFLLLCNFAMWIINTFETQKPEHNPLQVQFYGPEAWSIFSHISVPLGIYYRFHSTVCLSNIWKNAWKIRKHH